MKVKIGDKIFDSKEEPIMMIFSDDDKNLINAMSKESKKYCSYPDSKYWIENDYERIKKWMKIY